VPLVVPFGGHVYVYHGPKRRREKAGEDVRQIVDAEVEAGEADE
jgi:hypothetical protein